MRTFRIEVVFWGSRDHPFSCLRLFRGGDPHPVEFRGDAYWQWGAVPERNRGKGFCWSQALHDALEGWHSCVLHAGESVTILESHPDFHRVQELWERSQKG